MLMIRWMPVVSAVAVVLLTAFVPSITSAKDISHVPLASDDSTIEEPPLEHHLEKRFVFTLAAVATVAPIASAVFGGGSFIYGIVNGQQRLRELREINAKLSRMEAKIDELITTVQSLQSGQQWLEGVILYGDDVQRLQFLIDVLVNQLHLDDEGKLAPETRAHEWADAVLDFGSDGASQVLNNLHDMVMGTSGIFGGNSLIDIYKQRLDERSLTYWSDVKTFVEYVISLEVGGYAAWITALNLKQRTDSANQIYELAARKLEQQAESFLPLLIELDHGLYRIESLWGCPSNKFCNADLSWDYEDPHPMASVEHNDPVTWELLPQGGRQYVIRSNWGCPSDPQCNAELSWDYYKNYGRASVEFGDRILWEISPRGTGYVVKSKWGCPDNGHCNAELSWDYYRSYGRASVEHNDPIDWAFTKLD